MAFIDCDSHVLEPEGLWREYLEPGVPVPLAYCDYRGDPLTFGAGIRIPGCQDMPVGRPFGMRYSFPGLEAAYEDYARRNFPPDVYEPAMDDAGFDRMVVYPTTGLYLTAAPELDAHTAAAYRRAYNNWLADFCAVAGPRVIGAGAIDLRDAAEAAREARRCVEELGFKAIYLNPVPVGTHPLYDPYYDGLWDTIASLGVPVGFHPCNANAADTMLYRYLPGLMPAQVVAAFCVGTMLACAGLILGGVLERHPALRVVFLESGSGWVPFWLDRLDAGVQGATRDVEGGIAAVAGMEALGLPRLSTTASEYFKRQCFISADADDPELRHVIESIGDDNIVVATDFSHPEGRRYARAVHDVMAQPGVSEESKRKIMWDNAVRLYALDAGR